MKKILLVVGSDNGLYEEEFKKQLKDTKLDYTVEPVYSKLFEGFVPNAIKAIGTDKDIAVIVVADWFWEVVEFIREYGLYRTVIVLGTSVSPRLVKAVNLRVDRWIVRGDFDEDAECFRPSIDREVKEIIDCLS